MGNAEGANSIKAGVNAYNCGVNRIETVTVMKSEKLFCLFFYKTFGRSIKHVHR